ncbi:MAG: sulfatase-like hydrolase/transferase [Leptospira sp.]|nr:sulfatase-like hydrolase/transferase [Leptospira sp.]
MLNKIPPNLKLLSFYSFVYLTTLFLYRVAFLITYYYRVDNAGSGVVVKSFFVGLRFDLATCAILLGPFFILSVINFLNRYRVYRFIWGYLPNILFIWMISILIADLIYYENANKHIGYEGFVFFGKDLGVIFKSALEQNTIPFLLGITFLSLFFPVSIYAFLKYNSYEYSPKRNISSFVEFFLVFISVIFFVRGGFQTSPIRASNAIISENSFLNNLGLNGAFTSIMDMKSQSIPKSLTMKFAEASLIVREEINYDGAEFISAKYPILRKAKAVNAKKPPNIVVIMLENWTGKFLTPMSDGKIDGKELAPHFNRLSKEGIFFTRFFASGGRTTNGMMSILTGIPDRPGLTVVRTHQVLGNFSGLGNIMKSLGYRTIFATGGDLSFDNKDFLMPRWGFDTIYGKQKIDQLQKYKIGAWGYDDADVLDVLHNEIMKTKSDEPFLAVALTLTTHYPYRVPAEKFRLYDESTKDSEYLNVYHYADWALHDFMEKARKSGYFSNTVFLFVSDHAHHRFLNYYEDRNIPFLIYAPGKFRPETRNEIASQLDVIPTIVGIVGKETFFSAMGRDLLAPKKSHSAFFAYGNVFGWIEKDLFFFQGADGANQINFTVNKPHIVNPVCNAVKIVCEGHSKKAKAFLNLSTEMMNQNLIFPPASELHLQKAD